MTDKCPACNKSLNLNISLEINQLVTCSSCGVELEVVWLYPLELVEVIEYTPDQIAEDDHVQQ